MHAEPTFDAMLFDCDGVLVDSEPLVNQVLCEEIAHLGWQMSLSECMQTFVGGSLHDVQIRVHEHTGVLVGDEWFRSFQERRDAVLRDQVQPMRGAVELVALADQKFRGRIACASNSERSRVRLQLQKVGLLSRFDGRIFSAVETGEPKPSPAVYLAAGESMNPPSRSPLILEDSPSGVRAGKAASGFVIGLATWSSEHALRSAGAGWTAASLDEVGEYLRGVSVVGDR